MSFVKIGEAISITAADIEDSDAVMSDPEIQNKFEKIAKELKIIAPKGDDFLYFSAVMMHAAEHAAINDDGSLKVMASGEPIKVWWEKKGEGLIWKSNDPSIRPFKNNNGDIFPASELITAHKKWVGKPLCLDHKSSSVDMIRGLIVDTYYDHKLRRVVALCALDKKNYPDLARKVSTGYAASVSMGTGVGRAVCYDCSNVARTEKDFCSHMKNKSCYGEVNLDLNPIELSIVVNGADPKAKIKTIIAAADSIAKYVEMKEEELSKVEPKFKKDRFKDMLSSLEQVTAQLNTLKEEFEELSKEMGVSDEEESEDSVKLEKEASDKSSEYALKSISDKLDTIFNKINKLYSFNKDEKMTTKKQAYFQGGGGMNEPQTYPKEDAEKVRNTQDKQMVGQMDTGPVDGMHPGYDSFGESEESRKKRLQRLAEEEMRAMRRQAALEAAKANLAKKTAYHQGGGGVNDPQTYPKEDAEKVRNTQDKQMVGASPFPNTGDVDGLFPGDQEKKEKLSRAKLTARFLKAAAHTGNDDFANSRWEVFADKKLVFSASVNEITGGRAYALYDSVANEGFGRSLIAKIRTNGLEKVATMYKSAQAAPPIGAAPSAPAAPAAPGLPGAAPGGDLLDLPMNPEDSVPAAAPDMGGKGDPAENLDGLLDKADEVLQDIREGVKALQNKAGEPGGEAAEFEELAAPETAAAVSPATASLINMQKKLGVTILAAMKETAVKLASVSDELRLAKKVLVKNASLEVRSTVEESKQATREILADCYTLMSAFSKYASSTEMLAKQASQEVRMVKMAQSQDIMKTPAAPKPAAPKPAAPKARTYEELMKDPKAVKALKDAGVAGFAEGAAGKKLYMPDSLADDGMSDDNSFDWDSVMDEEHAMDGMDAMDAMDDMKTDLDMDDDMAHDLNHADMEMAIGPNAKVKGDANDMRELAKHLKASSVDDLSTKEGRAAYRAKQAAKAMQYSSMLDEAHGKGGPVLSGMKGEGAKVETLDEIQSSMLEVARKEVSMKDVSPKTKKAAEDIQKLVVAGRINASEVDQLVKAGLDKDAVKYWKDFYGQSKDKASKEFAADLTSEHAQAKKAENMDTFRVKIARAYDLANEMSMKGLIGRDKHAIKEQVDELMSFNDAGFESMKKHVERTPITRTASYVMPQVGLMSEELIATASAESTDLVNEFAAAFANRKY